MKKCICYLDESTMSVYQTSSASSLYIGVVGSVSDLTPYEQVEAEVKAENSIDEMIALKKAGFSASEIIELKQAKLM